jgi:hypothetical protein
MFGYPHLRRRSLGVVATLSLTAALAAGCGGSDSSTTATTAPAAGSTGTATTMPASTMDTTGTTTAAAGKPGFNDAVDLRVTLNRLLGEHMQIAVDATQTALLGGKSFDAKGAELQANTDDLAAAIGSLYGDDAKAAFSNQWNAHNGYFVNYTVATAKNDEAGKTKAVDGLMMYQKDFGAFLAGATGLPADAVQAQLGMHVMHTAKAVDAFGTKDYAGSYANAAMGYVHMGKTGDILADAIAKQKSLGATTSPAADLRVSLDDLLAEHAALAIVAMERGFDGSPDFDAAAASLDKNTVALGDVIGGAYGDEAKATFLSQWRAHIGFFVNYVTALAKKDDAGKAEAKKGLDGYIAEHGKFLAGATGLPADAVTAQLQMHVDELLKTIDDYAAGNYDEAVAGARMSFAHMYETGDALAGGIIAQKMLM